MGAWGNGSYLFFMALTALRAEAGSCIAEKREIEKMPNLYLKILCERTSLVAGRRQMLSAALAALCLLGAVVGLPAIATAAPAQFGAAHGSQMICTGHTGPRGDLMFAQYAPALQSGLYFGVWKDGRPMIERVNASANEIVITRMAGGDVEGKTSRYIGSGASQYNSASGHRIFVTGPNSFTWTNSSGQNGVSYTRQ